jgi:tyrosine-specific transport protein
VLNSKVIGAALLIAATAIGAGMLVFPTETARAGFFPSILIFIAAAATMLLCLFYLLEIILWMPPGSDLLSVAHAVLGNPGRIIMGVLYLLLFYAVLAAYIPGLAPLVASIFKFVPGLSAIVEKLWIDDLLFALLGAWLVYLGTRPIDFLNRTFTVGLIIFFICLCWGVVPHFEWALASRGDFQQAWIILPIALTAFTSHLVLPTIRDYLQSDVKKLKQAIFIGACIPLVFYSLWVLCILGAVPLADLLYAAQQDRPVAAIIGGLVSHNGYGLFSLFIALFSFFALATSFLGVSLSLCHFIMDGLKLAHTRLGRLQGVAYTFIPPMLFTSLLSKNLREVLGYAAILVILLFCVLIVMITWKGRYVDHRPSRFRVPGGKALLTLVFIVSWVAISVELYNQNLLKVLGF